MDSKKAAISTSQATHGLAEQQRTKRDLQKKLTRLKRVRDGETGPIERQIARLQTQVDQIRSRHAGAIGETESQIADADSRIALYEGVLQFETVPKKDKASRAGKGGGTRRGKNPFAAGTYFPDPSAFSAQA